MASLNGAVGVLSEAQQIASELGVDSWQIVQGSYNGVVFHVVNSIGNTLNNLLNPAAGIIDSTSNLLGLSGSGPGTGDNSSLPYGTSTVSTNITDMGSRKLVVHELPNNNDVFEDLGWRGEVFVIQGILFGSAYSQALNNLMNVMINDDYALDGTQNVLVHPILGTIQSPVFLVSYKYVHNANLWRSCMYEFIFRSSAPVSQISNILDSQVYGINSAISSILSIANNVLNTWNDITALQTSFSSPGNSYTIQQALASQQAQIQATVNASLATTQLLVNNLQPSGYSNVALNQTVVTPTNLIPSFYYFINNMTPSDVNSIINNNLTVINSSIASLTVVNNNIIYNTVSNLNSLQANITTLAVTLLNSYYGSVKQYTTPYDIDLVSICVLNNLDPVSSSTQIYLLNQAVIPSSNFIPKGTVLTIPISQKKSQKVIT